MTSVRGHNAVSKPGIDVRRKTYVTRGAETNGGKTTRKKEAGVLKNFAMGMFL
jgi:hypothetical protein